VACSNQAEGTKYFVFFFVYTACLLKEKNMNMQKVFLIEYFMGEEDEVWVLGITSSLRKAVDFIETVAFKDKCIDKIFINWYGMLITEMYVDDLLVYKNRYCQKYENIKYYNAKGEEIFYSEK
jgi:hypothetical protein